MTVETFEKAREIVDTLQDITIKKSILSTMLEQGRESYLFSNGNIKTVVDERLSLRLIAVMQNYYIEQTEKLEKEFEQL